MTKPTTNQLTPCSTVLLVKLTVPSQSRHAPYLRKTNVHYRDHNSPPHVPVVSQINPAQAISLSYFFDIDVPKKQQLFTTIDKSF
jgi:hypothetical protein